MFNWMLEDRWPLIVIEVVVVFRAHTGLYNRTQHQREENYDPRLSIPQYTVQGVTWRAKLCQPRNFGLGWGAHGESHVVMDPTGN